MQRHLAIASVPIQEWGALYGQEEALRVGTIYQDLNLPFFAAERDDGAPVRCGQAGRTEQAGQPEQAGKSAQAEPGQAERETMMQKIQEIGFVLDDLRLYMDTHPADDAGLTLLKGKLAERKTLLRAFGEKFYPLTPDCMADIYEKSPMTQCYCWQKGPVPWEGACV